MKLKELFEAEQKVREQNIVEIAELFESYPDEQIIAEELYAEGISDVIGGAVDSIKLFYKKKVNNLVNHRNAVRFAKDEDLPRLLTRYATELAEIASLMKKNGVYEVSNDLLTHFQIYLDRAERVTLPVVVNYKTDLIRNVYKRAANKSV